MTSHDQVSDPHRRRVLVVEALRSHATRCERPDCHMFCNWPWIEYTVTMIKIFQSNLICVSWDAIFKVGLHLFVWTDRLGIALKAWIPLFVQIFLTLSLRAPAIAGVAKPMLGALVVRDRARPQWPSSSGHWNPLALTAAALSGDEGGALSVATDVHPPIGYRQLTEACWAQEAQDRYVGTVSFGCSEVWGTSDASVSVHCLD